MKPERLYTLIRSPLISEKSMRVAERANQYVFKVDLNATKQEVKQAVEQLFSVKVLAVQTLRTMGKSKKTRNTIGKRSDVKKAYVTLAADQSLDLMSAVE